MTEIGDSEGSEYDIEASCFKGKIVFSICYSRLCLRFEQNIPASTTSAS